MPSIRVILAAFACFTLIACTASIPTVEDVNAQRAKNDQACEAKGYLHDTQDFQTCLNLLAQEQAKANVRGPGAAGFGSGFPSDERLKRDIEPVAALSNGLHLYRFRYAWSDEQYVGVIAQEVQSVMPEAVTTGPDGFMRVNYQMLGIKLMTLRQWQSICWSVPILTTRSPSILSPSNPCGRKGV